MKSLKSALMILTASLCFAAMAQQPKAPPAPDTSKYKVLIGTGAAGGTYDTMMRELLDKCSQGDTFGAVNTDGSIANIDGILANKLDVALVQEDVLFLKKGNNSDVNQLKTIGVFHPEEIHVFVLDALFQGKKIENGREWYGAKKADSIIKLDTYEALTGATVAAWGGSYDTARLLSSNSGTSFNVVKAANQDEAFAKLDKGEVQGVLAVTGAPAGNVEKLPGKYRLVVMKPDTINKLVAIYSGASLNYSNLNSEGVKTVATSAVLVSRDYTGDPSMLAALSKLRTCFQETAPILRNTRGKHAKWLKVNAANQGKWPWYPLPAATAAPAPTTAGKKPKA